MERWMDGKQEVSVCMYTFEWKTSSDCISQSSYLLSWDHLVSGLSGPACWSVIIRAELSNHVEPPRWTQSRLGLGNAACEELSLLLSEHCELLYFWFLTVAGEDGLRCTIAATHRCLLLHLRPVMLFMWALLGHRESEVKPVYWLWSLSLCVCVTVVLCNTLLF